MAPTRRSAMVATSQSDDNAEILALSMVFIGLVLALGATALALAGRREARAPARTR